MRENENKPLKLRASRYGFFIALGQRLNDWNQVKSLFGYFSTATKITFQKVPFPMTDQAAPRKPAPGHDVVSRCSRWSACRGPRSLPTCPGVHVSPIFWGVSYEIMNVWINMVTGWYSLGLYWDATIDWDSMGLSWRTNGHPKLFTPDTWHGPGPLPVCQSYVENQVPKSP